MKLVFERRVGIYAANLQDDGSPRRSDIVLLPSGQQDEGDKTKDTRGDEVGGPISVVTGDERRRDGSASSNVDSSVEVYNTNELHL